MKKVVLSTLCLGLFSISPLTAANDKVSQVYDPHRYQQVCKNKTQGQHVSFAHRGIIWNGTCQPQFMPVDRSLRLQGNEAQIYRACTSTTGTTTVQIDGRNVSGKCVLGFTPPQPRY